MPKAKANKKPRATDERVKLRVLLKNKRSCCVCHAPEKSVQLHHIDGDRNRTVDSNLAVLCLTHHDQATAGLKKGQVGLGVKLTPNEVRAHKMAWEKAVADELTASKRAIPAKKRKQFELLFEFELIKIKNELLAARTQDAVKARLAFLTEFLTEEFVSGIPYRKFILEALADVATRTAGGERVSLPLISALPDFHLHLVGPDNVEMRSADREAMLRSAEIVDSVGFFGVLLSRNSKLVGHTCKVLKELAEIASWYQFKPFLGKARKILLRMRKEYHELRADEKHRTHSKQKLAVIEKTLQWLEVKLRRKAPK